MENQGVIRAPDTPFPHLRDRIAASPVTGAWFSDEDPAVHRYALWRIWDADLPLLLIGALNPSTADHEKNDPTILREIMFAKRDGFGGIIKVNAFAYRSPDPKKLKTARDALGPHNKRAWREAAELCSTALIAFGNGAGGVGIRMAEAIAATCPRLLCLGRTKDGHPIHPLARGKYRVPDDAPMVPFELRRAA